MPDLVAAPVKIVIAGSRHCTDPTVVESAISSSPWAGKVPCVVEGGAEGVDRLARAWAEAGDLPVVEVPADWTQGRRSAGLRRNRALARNHGAQGVIVIWDRNSRGSASMLAEARKAKLPVFEYVVSETGLVREQLAP